MGAILFLLWLIGAAWAVALAHARRRAPGHEADMLARVNEAFRALLVESALPALRFDGRTAEIVDEWQDNASDDEHVSLLPLTVHRFARNAHGEYFYFISDGSGKPFFKHVPHTNARAVLGKKYVAP